MASDFLVHEGQVSFFTNDRAGETRMIDFDPAGTCFLARNWNCHLISADPDSLNGEKLILRTEYHAGAHVTVSKTIARRRTAEEEFAPQTQIVYGTPFML